MAKRPKTGQSLQDAFPALCHEWDSEKNGDLTTTQVQSGSHKIVGWKCRKCAWKWETAIKKRAIEKTKCPACTRKVLSDLNRLSLTNPELVKEWSKENSIGPDEISNGSPKKFFWVCAICSYEWVTSVRHRTSGQGCPACSGRATTDRNRLTLLRPELIFEWSPKNAQGPENFAIHSNKRVLWLCFTCQYEWSVSISGRSQGHGCPSCSGRVASIKNNLPAKRPELVQEWSNKNDRRAETVAYMSDFQALWVCSECSFEWKAVVKNRSRGHGCPACAKQAVTDSNRLSLLRPDLINEWSKNNKKGPDSFAVCSNKKVFWLCYICHREWSSAINNRTAGRNCPSCAKHGFNQGKPASFYLRKVCDGTKTICLKFGISSNERRRLVAQKRATALTLENIKVVNFEKGLDALNLERAIRKFYRPLLNEAERQGIYFDGSTETLPLHLEQELIAFIEQWKAI